MFFVKKRIKNIISYILLVLSGIIVALTIYIMVRFKHVSFEQLIFSLFYSKGTSINAIGEGIIVGIIILTIYLFIIFSPFRIKWNVKNTKIFPLNKDFFLEYAIYIFLLMFIASGIYLGLFKYLYYQINTTNILDNYVDPRDVDIEFPDEKKNLIYIFVESLEMSVGSVDNGGYMNKSYIPNLEKIALDNTSFSNTDKLGGAMQVDGVGWTMGGMVAQTAGIPLKVLVQGNHYNEYSSFLPGAYSIGEVLKDNGYHNYLMLGSKADFGGRRQYFQEHGDYEILDYYWAIKQRLIRESYYEWWGYEDSKLFQYAREKLTNISKNGEPFNFTILTADTHFSDGYIDKSCYNDLPFDSHYANSFYCSDKMIYEFIDWIKNQDFYKNTVVVITGDHLVMQGDIVKRLDFKDRVVYNVIINSNLETVYNKNRLFTTMDMYPTTLAAMGVKIPGDRLGMGVNLYSGEKTLLEEYDFNYVDREIRKRSKFYNQYILRDTYHEMYKNVGKKYLD